MNLNNLSIGRANRRRERGWLKLALFLFLSLCLNTPVLLAQHRPVIRGTVVDEKGAPLTGVTVLEEGTSNGTSTDTRGNFELRVSRREVVLNFTYVGYRSQKQKVAAGKHLHIEMVEDAQHLDDVVVIGYGTVRKSDLTGAVSSVKSDIMEDRQILSLEDALRGQLAGVSILSTDGAPGASMNIRIRGVSSINASNAPLYVVDGVQMESTDISPSEIESMEILKDASSTAIYGSRGANGVVIIKTKQGQKGRPRINFSTTISVQQPVNLYEMMNAREFARYCLWGYGRANGTLRDYYDLEGNIVQIAYAGNAFISRYEDIMSGAFTTDTDWQREVLRNAMVQDYRLTISGGDDKGSYSVMGSMLSQDGTVINSGMDRYNLRANFDRQVLPWLKIGVNMSGSSQAVKSVSGNVIKTMLSRPPTKSAEGDVIDITDTESTIDQNPVTQAYKVTNDLNRLNAMIKGWFDVSFAKIFRLNVSGSYNYTRTRTERYYPSDVQLGSGNVVHGRATVGMAERVDWQNENILYITPRKMGDHALDAMVGMTFQGFTNTTLNAENNNFQYEKLGVNDIAYGLTPIQATNGWTKSTMVSFLGRINYRFKEKYLFTASIRADGSSRLAPGNKWGYFPSGAFAWRAGEERFIKELNVFSNLKFRVSAGVSGNTGISPYQTQALMTQAGYPMDGTSPSFGLVAQRTSNPDLKWELSTQYDLGVDMGFLRNRVSLTLDLYLKKTHDLLLTESIPTYTGYTSRWTNRGKVDNRGLELTLNAVPVTTKNFSWDSSFNISFNRSKVIYIAESGWMVLNSSAGGASNFGILMEGEPIGLWYGYKENGVYRSQSEIDASGITSIFGNSTIRPGYVKYEDYNHDNRIDEADRQPIGCAQPKFTGGFINTFTYRNIALQVGLEFRYGGDVFNSTRMAVESSKGANLNQTKRAAKYGFYQTLFDRETGQLYFQGNEETAYIRTPVMSSEPFDYTCRSLYVEDASYLRFNDITLSYNLPAKVARKLSMQNLKIFFSVKNAWVITGYSGFDPDVNSISSAGADLMPGLDDAAYPRTRNYSVELNITF